MTETKWDAVPGSHESCQVCCYWNRRIVEERQRALKGFKDAYVIEKKVRLALHEHLERAGEVKVSA